MNKRHAAFDSLAPLTVRPKAVLVKCKHNHVKTRDGKPVLTQPITVYQVIPEAKVAANPELYTVIDEREVLRCGKMYLNPCENLISCEHVGGGYGSDWMEITGHVRKFSVLGDIFKSVIFDPDTLVNPYGRIVHVVPQEFHKSHEVVILDLSDTLLNAVSEALEKHGLALDPRQTKFLWDALINDVTEETPGVGVNAILTREFGERWIEALNEAIPSQ